MGTTRRWCLLAIGVVLGVALFLLGGIAISPPAPPCPGCAILANPYGSCNEAVQGGWVCDW